jgi:hypothetical protein
MYKPYRSYYTLLKVESFKLPGYYRHITNPEEIKGIVTEEVRRDIRRLYETSPVGVYKQTFYEPLNRITYIVTFKKEIKPI